MELIDKTLQEIVSRDSRYKERRLVIVLGSGWGPVVEALMEVEGTIGYEDLPGFPVSTVEGHAGQLLWGNFSGVPVYCMQGRFHFYEGYSMEEVTYPVRVFSKLGLDGILLTNAAGGINPAFEVGDLMRITDHINLMGDNPLRGANLDEFGPRFPDMTIAWDPGLASCLEQAAGVAGVELRQGVYLAVSGPNFETPAEIRAFSTMGADAVGMSTVPECLVARHCGLRVAGMSCITNVAAHEGGETLSHEDVSMAAKQAIKNVNALFREAVPRLHESLQ
jgi:purine-nucleoside phosphorylase